MHVCGVIMTYIGFIPLLVQYQIYNFDLRLGDYISDIAFVLEYNLYLYHREPEDERHSEGNNSLPTVKY